jgi:hypothetical protein
MSSRNEWAIRWRVFIWALQDGSVGRGFDVLYLGITWLITVFTGLYAPNLTCLLFNSYDLHDPHTTQIIK